MRAVVVWVLLAFEQFVLLYFLAINTSYLVCSVLAFFRLRQHRHRWTTRELEAVVQSPATPGVSVIAPAYNEQATIVESMRALLLLNYPQFEVICCNDGSKDETLRRAIEAFDLVEAPMAIGGGLPTAKVRAIYRSLTHAEFVLVDKENGGKADALNAGINAARYPLICLIDADSLLEPSALTQAVLPFLETPDTLAVGGIIRIVNGCTVEAGRVTERARAVELARALPGRRVPARLPGRPRRALRDGRAAHHLRRLRRVPPPGRDRRRRPRSPDHRRGHGAVRAPAPPLPRPEAAVPARVPARPGVLDGGAREPPHPRQPAQPLAARPVPGARLSPRDDRSTRATAIVGLLALPYYVLFEALGPVIEISGYVVTAGAIYYGLVNWHYAELMFLLSIVYGTLISLAAVVLEEISYRRYQAGAAICCC